MTLDNTEQNLIDSFGCSRTGKGRSTNGDQFMIAELKRAARVHHASESTLDDTRRFGVNQAHVLLVADSVGATPSVPRASSLVVDEVMESILNAVPWSPSLDVESEATLRQELKDTVVRCNEQVSNAARRATNRSDVASTMTLAFVRWPTTFIVHAGDSRAYLLRDGEIEQLTRDHTFAQQMVEDGELDPERAETSRFANMLWNAVGGDSKVTPEISTLELRRGDALLLCSDGLTSHLSDGAIQHIVESNPTAEAACEALVDTVTGIGGHDDVTVALARFEREVPQPATASTDPSYSEGAISQALPKRRGGTADRSDQQQGPARPSVASA